MSSPVVSEHSLADRVGDLADRLGTSVPSLLVGAVAVVGLAVLAWFALFRPDPPPPELTIPYASAAPAPAPTDAPGSPTDPDQDRSSSAGEERTPDELLVHAAGAVRHPGVYSMPTGARVSDLLAAAGGPLPEADLDRVNLASPVVDGSRVYVPRREEDPPPVVAGDASPAPPTGEGSTDPGQAINLNTATATQLEALPGVGPATAAAIVEHRDRVGSFASVDELINVRGIGEAKLAALRDLVHV